MELKEALKIVEAYQEWRQGKTDKMPYIPPEITTALDVLIKFCKDGTPKSH